MSEGWALMIDGRVNRTSVTSRSIAEVPCLTCCDEPALTRAGEDFAHLWRYVATLLEPSAVT